MRRSLSMTGVVCIAIGLAAAPAVANDTFLFYFAFGTSC